MKFTSKLTSRTLLLALDGYKITRGKKKGTGRNELPLKELALPNRIFAVVELKAQIPARRAKIIDVFDADILVF